MDDVAVADAASGEAQSEVEQRIAALLGAGADAPGAPADEAHAGPPPRPPSFERQRSRSMSPPARSRRGGDDEFKSSDADARIAAAAGGAAGAAERPGSPSDSSSVSGYGARRAETPPPDLRTTRRRRGKGKGGEAVQVIARFRPISGPEERAGGFDTVDYGADGSSVGVTGHDGVRHAFNFHRVLGPTMTQEEVYHFGAKHLVEAALKGINAAIICYGQTGSGKTYTMMGPPIPGHRGAFDVVGPARGIIPRMMGDLFTHLQLMDPTQFFYEVRCSYIEVYNEHLRDLLVPGRAQLRLMDDPVTGMAYTDASESPIESVSDVIEHIRLGTRNRVTAATAANPDSSRSHAVFSTSRASLAALSLVDLAGSEKISKTHASGERLREAQQINTSLLALGNVIVALSRRGKARHIPYRDSKLTRLLKNSFGGNAKTSLIVNVSPHSYNFAETLSTLRFGDRAGSIKNKPVTNERKSVAELRRQLDAANREVYEQTLKIREVSSYLSSMRRLASDILNRLPPGSPQLRELLLKFPMLRTMEHKQRKSRVMKRLPRFALGLVFTFLDGRSITRCSMTCTQWRKITSSEALWKEVFRFEYGSQALEPLKVSGDDAAAAGEEGAGEEGAAPEGDAVVSAPLSYRSLYVDRASVAYRAALEARRAEFEARRAAFGMGGAGIRLLKPVS